MAETETSEDRELCECPRCGRNHWRLGTPPKVEPAITMEQVVDWLNANTSSYTMQPRDRPHAQTD